MPESVLIPAPDRTNSRGCCWTKPTRSGRAWPLAGSNCECIALGCGSACCSTSGGAIIGLFAPPVAFLPRLKLGVIAVQRVFVEIENARVARALAAVFSTWPDRGDGRRIGRRRFRHGELALRTLLCANSPHVHRCRLAEVSVEQVIDERPVLRARAGVRDTGHDDELLVDCRGRRLSLGLLGPGSALRSGAERFDVRFRRSHRGRQFRFRGHLDLLEALRRHVFALGHHSIREPDAARPAPLLANLESLRGSVCNVEAIRVAVSGEKHVVVTSIGDRGEVAVQSHLRASLAEPRLAEVLELALRALDAIEQAIAAVSVLRGGALRAPDYLVTEYR